MHKALGLIPSTMKNKKEGGGEGETSNSLCVKGIYV